MRQLRLFSAIGLVLALAACGAPTATESPTAAPATAAPTHTPRPTATLAATAAPQPTVEPTVIPLATLTAELSATVVASLPPTATPEPGGIGGFMAGIDSVSVIPLEVASGAEPLWAVFSKGFRSVEPPQNHFVAIYSRDGAGWKELDRLELENDDYLDEGGVAQVQVEPSHVWLEAQGGAGAHSGCYDLLSFDGKRLRVEAAGCSSSPGAGQLEDLNGDGVPEVLLDATDHYVFCYACGVRLIDFQVLRWDGSKMVEVQLAPLPDTAPAELRRLTNEAVELAQAGLWKQAQATIDQALALSAQDPQAIWDAALIRLIAEARAEQARSGIYPLLDNLFYGDYDAALDAMRPYTPAQLFGGAPPLMKGTAAEGWEPQLTGYITRTTDAALALKPDLAAAYFLRGWAAHLIEPGNPEVLADIERAAQLAPQEALFKESLQYLRK